MDSRAIVKANSRLRVAKQAAQDLAACRDFDAFTDTWYTFLTAAKNIYTVLEQGAKISAQSKQWFGAKAAERRGDPLLQYLYEARNADEHGLEPVSEVTGGDLRLSFPSTGADWNASAHVRRVSSDLSVTSFEILDTNHSDSKTIDTFQTIKKARLVDIVARGNRVLAPPSTHRGIPIAERSPQAIANLALVYLEALVRDAAELA